MARALIEMTGRRFGRLNVLGYAGPYQGKSEATWLCQCDCGAQIITVGSGLRGGRTKSCGCERAERIGALNRAHDMTGTPEYMAWRNMLTRCYYREAINFDDYGGRGVTVCARWRGGFEAFFADMGAKPSADHSIDRIDNDGDYEPDNCRWATLETQRANRSNSILVEFRGEIMTLTKAIVTAGRPISRSCATNRLRKGWTIEEALFAPKTRTGIAA